MRAIVLSSLFGLAALVVTGQDLTCSFVLTTSQTNSSGVTRNDSITYAFQGANAAMLVHGRKGQPDMRLVFDPEAKTITQLFEMNGRKGGFVFAMSEKRWPGMSYSAHAPGTDEAVKYTGKAKTLQGHACREAKVANDKYAATVWVAEDIPLSMLRVFSYQSVGEGKSTEEADLLARMSMKGFPLEMDLKSLSDKPDVHLRIKDFHDHADPAMFSTEGHSTSWVED